MKVLILTADSNGGYPVPAVKGGAVSTLIEHLVDGNNQKRLCEMEIVSLYNRSAEKKAKEKYPNIKFTWIKTVSFFKLLDCLAFKTVGLIKKNEKSISFRSPFTLLYYIFKARRIVNKTNADKIVIENNIPLARVMKKSKFKGQWFYHFHNVPRIDANCREEFQKVSKYLCVSKFVAEKIMSSESAIGQIDSKKISVLYNCIDTQLFRPIQRNNPKLIKLKKQIGLKDDDFVCIFAGRLSEEKGPDKLLEAIQHTEKNVKCIIVGSLLSDFDSMTDYQKKLYSLAENLKTRVYFTGFVNHSALPYYYNLADVAVLPSMWEEPAGLTNLEAMACGIPVITTNSGGIPEYAIGAKQLERDTQLELTIAKEITHLLNDKKYREHMAALCLSEVKRRFDSSRYIDNLVDAIK